MIQYETVNFIFHTEGYESTEDTENLSNFSLCLFSVPL